jgi:hypothetical protein
VFEQTADMSLFGGILDGLVFPFGGVVEQVEGLLTVAHLYVAQEVVGQLLWLEHARTGLHEVCECDLVDLGPHL